jgi:hypothetical protein
MIAGTLENVSRLLAMTMMLMLMMVAVMMLRRKGSQRKSQTNGLP